MKRTTTLIATLSSLVFGFSMSAIAQSPITIDVNSLGPQVGEYVPNFNLPDQNGQAQTLDSIMGPNGAMLLFHRSADWWPYCKAQLVELEDRLQELEDSGIGVAAISYDSTRVLSDFAEKRGISFSLLSDKDSAVITEFGILNTVVAEALGPRRDDPEVVAAVHKYVAASVFDSIQLRQMINGTPFPGTFMLDAQGRVTWRYFEEFYRERSTRSTVLLKAGIGLTPIAAIEGTTAQLKFTAYPSNTTVTNGTRFSLAVDVEPHPNMHVYAPGAEKMGYRVVGFNMNPSELVRFEPVNFPEPEIYHFKPLDEHVEVYQKKFTLLQEAVVNASAEAEELMEELDALTLSGSFDYQACDDAICYLPASIPITFTLELEHLDYQRVNQR